MKEDLFDFWEELWKAILAWILAHRPHRVLRVSGSLIQVRQPIQEYQMTLEQKLNEFPVVYRMTPHTAINGGIIPSGSQVEVTSNDETVATVPPGFTTTTDMSVIDMAVQQVAAGSTDIGHTITFPDGIVYQGMSTLILDSPQEGVISVVGELIQIKPPTPVVNPLR